jgi:hypothetical protein
VIADRIEATATLAAATIIPPQSPFTCAIKLSPDLPASRTHRAQARRVGRRRDHHRRRARAAREESGRARGADQVAGHD